MIMKRDDALKLVKSYVKNENSRKHMIAVEAVMRSLAEKFGEDKNRWGLVGLLHDIDMELVEYGTDPERHGEEGARILRREGLDPDITEAVRAHNPATGKTPETLMEKAIYCTDPITGLIVASTLVLPSRKISDLNVKSVVKRFKEKSFARGANRDTILSSSEIGIELEEFIEIALRAMQEISEELGL
jgi:putative nucleotidyltransferase with HDIG domain